MTAVRSHAVFGPKTLMVVVAETDKHYVHAMDARSGRIAWTYTADGRVEFLTRGPKSRKYVRVVGA